MTPRVAFVTSGARGLGHVTVRTLAAAGWQVFFTYRNSDREAFALVESLQRDGIVAGCTRVDLLDKAQVLSSLAVCQDTLGPVSALIHNFGPFVFEREALADYTDAQWSLMLDGNLSSLFWYYRAVIPSMRAQQFGRIVTIGYDGAAVAAGWRYRAAYAAAKAGLASLTRSIAREERGWGVTANMVCPGDIRGEMKQWRIDDVTDIDAGPGTRPYPTADRPPVGEDVARVIRFLCEPDSQQLNGTVTEVTGGYDIRLRAGDRAQVLDAPQTEV